eukprot:TRINITY_DN11072_c0_g1_i1.p1 TRINITY_DN11072_c0_g1~~TRINITY_DN11072_c0_g1_i1.p1  ORF type:complete len:624 (+),score=94.38 TRINITY_DN11072_c0_g1_i1:76-1872(+)
MTARRLFLCFFSTLALSNAQVDRTGACICDFTEGLCDANCCCDTDCEARTIYLAFTKCRREQYGSKKGVKCTEPPVSLLEPYYINPTGAVEAVVNTQEEYYSRKIVTRNTETEKNTVCIVTDNLGLDDSSFRDPLTSNPLTTLDSISVIESRSLFRNVWYYDRETYNGDWTTPPSAGTLPESENILPGVWYRVGDRVTAVRLTDPPATMPFLILPKNVNGVCNDITPAYFLRNVISSENNCNRIITNLEQQCTSPMLSISRWRNIGIAPPEGPDLTGATLAQQTLPGTVLLVDGSGTPLADQQIETLFDVGSRSCINAVQSVQLSIRTEYPEDQGSTFLNFDIVITTTTIPDGSHSLSQNYGVAWLDKNTDAALFPTAGYSGAPGYVKGDAIRTADGLFSLPIGFDCANAALRGVKFLFDVTSSGCLLSLNRDEFSEACREGVLGNSLPQGASGLPTSIAAFANSDPANVDDWVTILSPPQSDRTSFMGTVRSSCEFLVGYEYTVIVRRMGKVYNPQDVIAGVKRDPIYATWTYSNALGDPTNRQKFLLQWRVSFVRDTDIGTEGDAIESPPFLPIVSDDIFYPFHIKDRSTVSETEL